VIFKSLITERERGNWYKVPSMNIKSDLYVFSNLESGKFYDISDLGYLPREKQNN